MDCLIMFKQWRVRFVWIFYLVLLFSPLKALCQIDVPTWVDDIGSSSSNCISSTVVVDQQNNIFVTGFFSNTADFDPTSGVTNLTASGTFDTFLAKYTPAGKLIWAKRIGGTDYTQVNSMAIDGNGDPIICGQFDSPTNFNTGTGSAILTPQGYDAFVAKYDNNGNFIWAKDVGGGQTDYGSHVVTDSKGDVIACIRYESTITVNGNSYSGGSGFNGLTIKYDPNGNFLWGIAVPDPVNSEMFTAVDNQDNILIAGHFTGTDNFNPLGAAYTMNGNGNSGFVAKYTTTGSLIWANSFAGVQTDVNVCVDSENDPVVVGTFSLPLNFNGTMQAPMGSQDIFMSKYTPAGVFQSLKDIGNPGANSIFIYSVVANQDNVFITGYFNGTIDFDPSPSSQALVSYHGQQDFFLAKYDNNLNYNWAFSGGSPNCSQSLGRNVTLDNSNNVLFTGGFCSTVNFSPSSCAPYPLTAQSGSRDCFLGKYVQNVASAATQITSFSVPQESSPAVIDQTNLKITVNVPAGTNVTALVPTIAYTSGVTLSPASGAAQNFSSNVTYNLSSSCASTLNYTVIVIVAPTVTCPTIAAPTVASSSVQVCSGATAALSVTSPQSGLTYNWYTSATGTTIFATGSTISVTPTTPASSYFVEGVNSNGCESPRTEVDVTDVALPTSPTIAPQTICSGSSAVLAVSQPQAGITYNWYNAATGGTLLATGTQYTTPLLSATTTYYTEADNTNGCASARTATVVTVNQTPPAPASFTQAICSGNTATLTLADAQAGVTYNWYDSATKTNLLFTGTTYTTGILTATTSYYVQAVNGTCSALTLADITVTVNPIPAAPTVASNNLQICAGALATLSVTNPQPGLIYNWYPSNTSTTLIITGSTISVTPSTSIPSYFVEAVSSSGCESLRTEVDVSSIPLPASPVISPQTICSGSTAVLAVSQPQAGITYNWYDAATGGTLLAIGTQYTTPALTASTTYYTEADNTTGCASTRTATLVTINQMPVTPVSFTQSICEGSTATLTLANVQAGVTYNWYDSPAETNLVFTGTTYTTGALITSTSYYVQAVNATCPNSGIATIGVTVVPTPAAPVVANNPLSICASSQDVVLNINNPQAGYTYNWYSSATSTTILTSGVSYDAPAPNATNTYYVEAVNSTGCISPQTPVTITVNPEPSLTVYNAFICPGDASATLKAETDDANATISWYADSNGNTLVGTGSSITVPVNLNATYYARSVDNTTGCTRGFAPGLIKQYPQLAAPVVTVAETTSSSVTFTWTAVPDATGYQVSTDNGITFNTPSSGSTGLSETITGLQPQQSVTILVQAVGSSACQVSLSSTAITAVAQYPQNDIIYVANTFTPNGDGKNDIVYVHSNSIKSMSFYVYDQWGEMLFRSDNINVGWDGTYKGKNQPVGVYVYFVKAVMNDGQQLTKKGTITLLR